MASSQVEVATSNPFGCVLRDHNSRRDRRRDTNGNSNQSPKSQTNSFQRNFKDLVRDHLQSCISLSPRASSNHETDENSNHQCGGFSCFGGGANAISSKTTTITAAGSQKNGGVAGQKAKEVSSTRPQAQVQSQNQTSFITGSAKKERRDPSPAKSESSSSDFSVSSLVQKWRGFEANHASCSTTTSTNSMPTATTACAPMEGEISRATSGVSICESILTTADESGERVEMSSVEERETPITRREEEEMKEQQRERERERERERIRVADIVRKWPGDESGVCLARLKIRRDNKGKCEGEGKTFSPHLVASPRIRGRQAIADLSMRMERERYDEVEVIGSRHPVTKFPHRGRIQALFRLRLLRRDQTIEEQRRPPLPPPRVVESSRCRTGTSITSLKEKFNDSVHQRTTSNKETPNSSKHGKQIASISKHISEKASPKHEPNVKQFLAKREQETENASTSSKQSIDDQSFQISKKINFSTISNESYKQISTKEELTIPSHSDDNENVVTSNKNSESQLDSHCEEEEAQQNTVLEAPQDDVLSSEDILQVNDYEEDGDVNMEEEPEASYNGYWGQGETDDYYYKDADASQSYFEPNLDWISDIARPRSYWEDLRQAWYQEVFNTRSQNEEIRQLLERGSVSNVLASDFRERMDHLIMNSVQRAIHTSLEEHEDERSMRAFLQEHGEDARQENIRQLLERGCVSAVLASDFGERIDQLFMNRISSVVEEQNEDTPSTPEQIEDDGQEDSDEEEGQEDNNEEEGQEDNEEEDEQENGEILDEREDESSYRHQYQNVNDFYEQNSAPSQLHWDEDDDESNYYSDNAESTSLLEPSPLTSYDRGTHAGSSSFKNPSIEMELIYDLRSHMEQLYREIAELRKSVTSCMDMQIKMQHNIREEVSTAIMRKGSGSKVTRQVERKDSNRRKPKKGTCCICCEKKVDSLLYKCGHMCTCFDCANELQWGSGKCPICRAQIIDVVQAFPDS